MKRVVSVSIGTAARDHVAVMRLYGQEVSVERRGTGGDLERAVEWIRDLDGTVDAIGLGGIDLYLSVGDRRYVVRDAQRLQKAATITPITDGVGVKKIWEPEVIRRLLDGHIIHPGQRVLMVSALDRWPMAQALAEAGFEMVYGDLMFGSRIDYPIRSLQELQELGQKLLPELVKLPFRQLYPIGQEQNVEPDPRFARYFDQAEVLAGDFHYIRRYMPDDLSQRTVITNTTTVQDIANLRKRAVKVLVTTTPRLDGRTFGANVIEAALVATTGLDMNSGQWPRVVRESGLEPAIIRFEEDDCDQPGDLV